MVRQKEINKKFKIVFTIFLLFFFGMPFSSPLLFSEPQNFTPKEIILKAIQASGGEEVLRRCKDKDYSMKAHIYDPAHAERPVGYSIHYFKNPDKRREEYRFYRDKNLFAIRIYSPGSVYTNQNGRVNEDMLIVEYRKRAESQNKVGLFALLYLLDYYDKVNYIGEELMNGRKCFGLEIFTDKDVKVSYFFDAQTFLMAKSIRTILLPGRVVENILYYYDFRKVSGINLSFRMDNYEGGVKLTETRVTEISFDELPDNIFIIPDNKS